MRAASVLGSAELTGRQANHLPFTHVTMPPKAVCSVGDIDITLFLLSRGWAELADDVRETTYVEALASAQSEKVGIWGGGPR